MITKKVVKRELVRSANFGHWYGVITVRTSNGHFFQRYLMTDGSFGRGDCFQSKTQLKFLLDTCSDTTILTEFERARWGILN